MGGRYGIKEINRVIIKGVTMGEGYFRYGGWGRLL